MPGEKAVEKRKKICFTLIKPQKLFQSKRLSLRTAADPPYVLKHTEGQLAWFTKSTPGSAGGQKEAYGEGKSRQEKVSELE